MQQFLQELLKKDIVFKVAAVCLALLLWFYVTNLQNPVIEKTISVPVNYIGLKEGLVMSQRVPNVEVKVRGPNSSVSLLSAKDIKVTIDLTEVKIGESDIPVDQVTVPKGIEVISTKPQSIHIFVDAIKEKQLPVTVEYINSVAQGYSSYEPVITPSLVVVRGANQILAGLETAKVTVDLNNAASNLVLSLPVQILGKDKNPVPLENLEVSPDKLQVFVPIVKNTPTKTVIIKPVTTGKPKDGFVVARLVSEPETMKITGPADIIENIDQILTRPIDLSGLEQSTVVQTGLDIPEGVSLLYSATAKVLIQIEEAPITKTFEELPITVENQPSGYKAELSRDKVKVIVKGPREQINNLSESSVRALVDLRGLETGTYKQEIKMALPTDIQVVNVEPSTVEVTLSRLPG